MSIIRYLGSGLLVVLAGVLSGCGGANNIQAAAPAPQGELVGTAPEDAQYSVYRGLGYGEGYNERIERVATFTVRRGQALGFRWEAQPGYQYNAQGGLHLIAFAGHQQIDLGPFVDRDMKYVWAGNNADVAGFFRNEISQKNFRAVTMQ